MANSPNCYNCKNFRYRNVDEAICVAYSGNPPYPAKSYPLRLKDTKIGYHERIPPWCECYGRKAV